MSFLVEVVCLGYDAHFKQVWDHDLTLDDNTVNTESERCDFTTLTNWAGVWVRLKRFRLQGVEN